MRIAKWSVIVALSVTLLLGCSASAADDVPPPAKIDLQPVAKGFERPTFVTHDGTKRLFVVEQPGRIRLIKDGQLQKEPYLDITKRVKDGGECGLLGMAFHPNFAKNGYFYVDYTRRDGNLATVISEFHVDPSGETVDAGTERILLTIDQPYANHNGGQVAFGPDGMLYIGMGDGGSRDDPQGNGQNLNSLLGKILRIDVNDRTKPYAIPKDNPWADGKQGRAEIWTWGMRNPWRFSFDPLTGDCYAADVGQNKWEEIDLIIKGGNYGWRPREALHPNPNLKTAETPGSAVIDPILEYPHEDRNISVTGGYVYRGKQIPNLVGWYLYADYSSGRIWALKYEKGKPVINSELIRRNISPSSFGEDVDGELYVCDHGRGEVLRIVAGE